MNNSYQKNNSKTYFNTSSFIGPKMSDEKYVYPVTKQSYPHPSSPNYNPYKDKGSGSLYSNTSHSDMENIYISRLRVFTEDLQNNCYKHPEYYELLCKVINENNLTLAELNNVECISSLLVNEGVSKNDITEIRKIYSDTLLKNPYYNDIGEFKNYIVEEIVSEDSGYDAVVLKNPENGNISIENCCTNNKSLKDLSFIAYAMSKDLTGGTSLLSTIGRFFNLVPENITDGLASLNGEECEKIYNGQINDSIKLIKKYSEKLEPGAKLELYGYSLGGGCMATALADLMMKNNKDVLDKIDSVTLYNPFLLIAEEYNKDAVNKLVQSDKLLIYSTQEDFVTEFNDIIGTLDQHDKVVYLNCEFLEFNDVIDLMNAVTGGAGNHGFSKIKKYNDIDENGNLKTRYRRISLCDTALKTEGKTNVNNRQEAFKVLLNYLIKEKIGASDYSETINYATNDFFNYLYLYWGDCDQEIKTMLGYSLSDALYYNIIYPTAKSQHSILIKLSGGEKNSKHVQELLGRYVLRDSICFLLNTEESYSIASNMIDSYLKGDLNGYYIYSTAFYDCLSEIYEREYNELDGRYGIIDKHGIKTIKKQFLNTIKKQLKNLYIDNYYKDFDVTFSEQDMIKILYEMNKAGNFNEIKYAPIEEPGSVSPENMEPVDIYDVMNHDATIADYVAQIKGVPRESEPNSTYNSLDYNAFRSELYEIYEENGNGLTFEEYFGEKYKKYFLSYYFDALDDDAQIQQLIDSVKPDINDIITHYPTIPEDIEPESPSGLLDPNVAAQINASHTTTTTTVADTANDIAPESPSGLVSPDVYVNYDHQGTTTTTAADTSK